MVGWMDGWMDGGWIMSETETLNPCIPVIPQLTNYCYVTVSYVSSINYSHVFTGVGRLLPFFIIIFFIII